MLDWLKGKEPDAVIQKIADPLFEKHGVGVFLLREDLLHPQVSGNKWRKLKYNLFEAERLGKNTLLSFGGAYSNHIFALAAAAKASGFRSIGIIRGEEHLPLNPTLNFARSQGMTLRYMDRETYRHKHEAEILESLRAEFGDFYAIPEGGTNGLAVKGSAEIAANIPEWADVVCCPCGTGGTLAGIVAGMGGKKQIIGFPALKGGAFLAHDIEALARDHCGSTFSNWELELGYHCGGYAKNSPALAAFIEGFHLKNPLIRTEFVYTGKMLYGIYEEIKKGRFAPGTKILAVHTGGLQILPSN